MLVIITHGNLLLLLTFSDYTMSPATVTILINPPPIYNQFRKLCFNNQNIPFSSPSFLTLKTSEFGYQKSVRLKKTMAAESIESGLVGSSSDNELITSAFEQETLIANNHNHTFYQTLGGLHVIFNKVVSILFSLF